MIAVVGEFEEAIVAAPDTTLHVPVPIATEFAAIVVEVALQISISGPAIEVVGGSTIVISTSSVDVPQPPFVTVHLNVAVAPIVKPVKPEVGEEGVVIVAIPDTTLHVPVPLVGLFPASVAVVELQID